MKILNLDNWCDEATAIVQEIAEVAKMPNNDVDGAIVSLSKHTDCIKLLPNLKFIASCTTGLDHIDTEYCKAKGIEVISLQGETDFLQDVWATSEHTWALIMSLVRRIPWAFNDVKQGNWDREQWQGVELRGKTLGIVGYGRVGQQVAKFANAFGMNLIVHEKLFSSPIDVPSNCLIAGRFEDVLRYSDIITVHVPLNEQTKGMFGIEQFQMMEPTAYFINTSRGAVINEFTLIAALLKKWIAGAAIDVTEHEPDIHPWLRQYAEENNNLIITPHIAGNTAESRKKTQLFIASKIVKYIKESAK